MPPQVRLCVCVLVRACAFQRIRVYMQVKAKGLLPLWVEGLGRTLGINRNEGEPLKAVHVAKKQMELNLSWAPASFHQEASPPIALATSVQTAEQCPLWRGSGNIHGFALGGQAYQHGWVTAQTLNDPAVSAERITTLLYVVLVKIQNVPLQQRVTLLLLKLLLGCH